MFASTLTALAFQMAAEIDEGLVLITGADMLFTNMALLGRTDRGKSI
jgi:hypothetical protein